jgi:hypothetical protein
MSGREFADALNQGCHCEAPPAGLLPGIHSGTPVFVDAADVLAMHRLVEVVESVVRLPRYQQAVLDRSPEIARHPVAARGVFLGFDFHVSKAGPKLIEINTNAGGAMLNAVADWRRPACCLGADAPVAPAPTRGNLESAFVGMFREEWRRARGDQPLESIAIVDDAPGQQFLQREFELFADLFRRQGIEAVVADAGELEWADGRLRWRGLALDMIYNRVTDFYFEHPGHEALRAAYLADAAVITPHPRAHALYADKRNLQWMTDAQFLRAAGTPPGDIDLLLAGIPATQGVEASPHWWPTRKQWFFKPNAGFGSRGAYRGDKLTRRVFEELVKGGYVAQKFVPAGERLDSPDTGEPFKVDLRLYVYDGRALLLAARLYKGQTTNFRTAGGGFAPVLELRDGAALLQSCVIPRDIPSAL